MRFTLDLQYEQHKFLKQFAMDHDVQAPVVLRARLARLADDATLAAAVGADLELPATPLLQRRPKKRAPEGP